MLTISLSTLADNTATILLLNYDKEAQLLFLKISCFHTVCVTVIKSTKTCVLYETLLCVVL